MQTYAGQRPRGRTCIATEALCAAKMRKRTTNSRSNNRGSWFSMLLTASPALVRKARACSMPSSQAGSSSRLQRLSRVEGSMGMGEILPPEFGVLLVGKVKSDLAGLALNHHFENLPVLGHLYSTGALGELDQGFIAVKSGSARQRRAHSVGVEEDHVPGIPVSEGHQDLVTSRLRRCELHRGIVGEHKANNYYNFYIPHHAPCV